MIADLFETELAGKIRILGDSDSQLVLLQMADERELEILGREYREIVELTGGESFALLAIKVNNWNDELSPWPAPPVFGKEAFGSGAAETLEFICSVIIPALMKEREDRVFFLGGYSLAGLFALWAAYRSDTFAGVAGGSPSAWFPGFLEYVKDNEPLTRNVYLSLGDREDRSRNPIMAQVGSAIRDIYSRLEDEGVNCTLEWNEGNHFRDAELRTAKGFAWLINQRKEQLKRIEYFESVFDDAKAIMSELLPSIEEQRRLEQMMEELRAYFESPAWRSDYLDDEAGFIPKDIKRGVLSQDGLYDALENYEIRFGEKRRS